MGKTFYDVLAATAKYDGSTTAHADVIATIKKHGHTVKSTDAWCSETVMAYFYDAGCIDLIGGYAADSGTIKKHAEKLGIWHKGDSGIIPGDIVLYGSGGKTNHTEFAVGATVNISGNYNGGCSRRKRSGRSIVGYVRPKYSAMPKMDNLQVMCTACDAMLNVYGSGETRVKMMAQFGAQNIELVQKEITRVWGDGSKMPFDFAVYIIKGRAGKNPNRKNRLGSYYTAAQAKVDEIYALRTHSKEQAARDVINNKYGTGAVRAFLLTWNGFNAEQVQNLVNVALASSEEPPDSRFRIYPVWFFEKNESAYGDCTAIIEYSGETVSHCVLIDTGMDKTGELVISKLKAQGVKKIDALVISHGHGDHYGAASRIIKAFNINQMYLPDCTELDKYQKTYGNRLRRQAQKVVNAKFLKAGDSFTVGNIKCDCVYLPPAKSLAEHDDHHFVNNESIVLRFNLGGIIYHSAGDLQNEGNNPLIKAVPNLKAHVFKCQWHGDGNATNDAICKAVKPRVAFFNYHHKESSGNRQVTRKRLEAVGATVYRNYEDGDIYIDCQYPKITVKTSKSGKHDTYTVGG